MSLQVVTADEGKLLWISPALAGGTHDVKAAREHDIVDACELDLESWRTRATRVPAAR